jgi:endonuclease/exonuclease/phosphatase family metal-dependent hydrolase
MADAGILYLAGHGETDWNAEGRWQGQADVPGHDVPAGAVPRRPVTFLPVPGSCGRGAIPPRPWREDMRAKIFVLAVLCAACGLESTVATSPASNRSTGGLVRREEATVTVMTRNLYLGADILPLAQAASGEDALLAANAVWATVQASHFPARAAAIAREVEEARPDLLALQEVTFWRLGAPMACLAGWPVPPAADETALDFLEIMLRALDHEGLHYEVAAQVTSMDAELCIGDPSDPASLRDLRYTDRDVILVRKGVKWRDPALPQAQPLPGFVEAPVPPGPGDRNGGIFAVALESGDPATAYFTVGGSPDPVFSWRGWTAVELERGERWVRVFETHVEDTLAALADAGLPTWYFQALQDAQLVAVVDAVYLDPATTLPTIVLGDFNAYVEPADPSPATYAFLTGGPFPLASALDGMSPLRDAWTALHPGDRGFTWGFDEALYSGRLLSRLDLVLATPELVPRAIQRTGVRGRTRTGQHPSDHAGLVATFQLH